MIAEPNFWGHIPGSSRTLERQGARCLIDKFRETKIADLQFSASNEYVFRFEIAVNGFGVQHLQTI
jgi:hypothetical protein